MTSKIPWLKFAAFVCLVTMIECVALRGTASWTNSAAFTSPQGLEQRQLGDNKNKFKYRNRQQLSNSNSNKYQKNFADDKTTQMAPCDGKQRHDFNEMFQPRDSFKCPPCLCKNISSPLVIVFCESSNITSIPQNWPIEIDAIIIEECHSLEELDSRNFLIYSSLTHVKITCFSLSKVLSSNGTNSTSTVTELDISYNEISTVEDNSFVLFPNLLKLLLHYNNIRNLTRQMFTGLSNLRSLSVSHNHINFIANDTFDDMETLVTLDISNNLIIYKGHDLLPFCIFIPLKNLEELYISNFCENGTYLCGTYPNKALQVLPNLKLLSIDGADSRGLGPEIKSLIHLRHLIITYAETDNADDSFFDNVPLITTLTTFNNGLHVNPKAYSKLKHLVILTQLTYNLQETDICQVLNDIQYLLNSSLKYLTLSQVNDGACGCKELIAKDAKYLAMLKLVELDLSKNYLAYLSRDFLTLLPASLKKIDLSGNGLSYEIFYNLKKFPKELIELNLNDQFNIYHPCQDGGGINSRHVTTMLVEVENKHSSNTSSISKFSASEKSFKQNEKTENFVVSKDLFHPKLRILRGDNFRYFGVTISNSWYMLSNYSLRELSLAGGDFFLWAEWSLWPDIEIADFSNNYASVFNPFFFPVNSSLKYLSFSNNILGTSFQYDTESLFFQNTKRLIALDMSSNFITELTNDYLKNLVKLEILDISKNKLQMINISFAHMTEIRILDFSTNSITSISKQSRDELDSIAADHRVYLDLTSNPLPCTCEGLELMKWMALTNVYLLNHDFLVCRNEYNQVLEIGDLVQRVETLQRQCASKAVIILTCVFSFIVFGILLLTSLTYRYRWKLRYLRSIALVKLVGSRPGAVKIGYKFDAYILYSDNTRRFVVCDCVHELEKKRGHRLCIEERDFLPGTYIVSNIVSGVQNSAKTVAMVTPGFYQGEYSEYGVKMALMEEIFMHRPVLFLCMYEPTDNTDLSHDLLTAMKQNNYIEFPPRDDASDEIMDDFWNQLSRAIGISIDDEL